MSSNDTDKYDLSFKMIVIGDAGVGKSCLTSRACKDTFSIDYSATVGFEFFTYTTKIDNKIIKLQIWDTCGQEIYRSLITNFYRNASLAMMVYSIDYRESFININRWLKEVKIQSNPDVKVVLIGNKADLNDDRQVTYQEAKRYKDENQILYFEEASAKTGINAKEIFNEAARLLYSEHNKYKLRANNSNLNERNGGNNTPTKLTKVEQNRNKGFL